MKSALGVALKKHSLTLQDVESFLQASNLSLTTLHTLCIRLWFGNAALHNAGIILVHRIQLLLDTRPVGGCFGSLLIKAFCFFCLVFHILILCCLCDFILLCRTLILRDGSILCGNHLSQALGEVRLAYFQETNDTAAGTISWTVSLVSLGIILPQNFQSEFHALD